jgi:hypothetical protein
MHLIAWIQYPSPPQYFTIYMSEVLKSRAAGFFGTDMQIEF